MLQKSSPPRIHPLHFRAQSKKEEWWWKCMCCCESFISYLGDDLKIVTRCHASPSEMSVTGEWVFYWRGISFCCKSFLEASVVLQLVHLWSFLKRSYYIQLKWPRCMVSWGWACATNRVAAKSTPPHLRRHPSRIHSLHFRVRRRKEEWWWGDLFSGARTGKFE